MPEAKTRKAVARDKREGKSASTQAGEFVREEIEHVREGKHGARSARQAIAIGLSKARRAGIKAPVSKTASKATRRKAAQDTAAAEHHPEKKSPTRARAVRGALKREGDAAASHTALSRQGKSGARKRSSASRSAAAKKAARTKGAAGRSAAARKAARTRKART